VKLARSTAVRTRSHYTVCNYNVVRTGANTQHSAAVSRAAAKCCGELRSVAWKTPHRSRRHVRCARAQCYGHARVRSAVSKTDRQTDRPGYS